MQPTVKKIENTESTNAFRFADNNPLGNMITVETSYGLSKRQQIVAMLIAGYQDGVFATAFLVDAAYNVADLILAGPSSEKDIVDLDQIGRMDPNV